MAAISDGDWATGKCFLGNSEAVNPNVRTSGGTTLTYLSHELPQALGAVQKFRKHLVNQENRAQTQTSAKPRHSPDAHNALVLREPSSNHNLLHNPKNRPVVPVVVDPFISSQLRPHQREGVAFLYESVCGMKDYDGSGAILADEMGLGKVI